VEIEGMGHDLARALWPEIIDRIVALVAKAGGSPRGDHVD
jgi:hypothetical protein